MLQSLRMHSCHWVPGPLITLITLQLELTFLHSCPVISGLLWGSQGWVFLCTGWMKRLHLWLIQTHGHNYMLCAVFVVEAAPDFWLTALVHCLFLSITVWVFKDHANPSISLKRWFLSLFQPSGWDNLPSMIAQDFLNIISTILKVTSLCAEHIFWWDYPICLCKVVTLFIIF